MQSLNFNSILKRSNYHRPLIFNGVLWSLAFVILLFVFSKGNRPITVDFIYTTTFLVLLAIPVSINFYSLIPKLLKQEKYGLFCIAFILNLIVFALLSIWVLQPLLDQLFSNYFFVSYLSHKSIFMVFSIVLIVTTLLKLAEDWFYFNMNENQILRQQNQHIQTQLSALRAQINPHFLFNSLNVIYALALEKKDGITNAIVQLSDVLRYVIYDADTERVSLKDELQLLQNYIAFQNHRIEHPNAVQLHIDVDNAQFKIYPMLLLPLLENSYKYGISAGETIEKPIKIDIYQHGKQFEFTISNANLDTKNKIEDQHSGAGLENIRNNLNLVYPNQHQFNIEAKADSFKVQLEITDETQ